MVHRRLRASMRAAHGPIGLAHVDMPCSAASILRTSQSPERAGHSPNRTDRDITRTPRAAAGVGPRRGADELGVRPHARPRRCSAQRRKRPSAPRAECRALQHSPPRRPRRACRCPRPRRARARVMLVPASSRLALRQLVPAPARLRLAVQLLVRPAPYGVMLQPPARREHPTRKRARRAALRQLVPASRS